MTQLVRYEAARNALAEARRVDEVKDIRDKAVAMETYARLAKDRELMEHATQIRVHAEIRAGELLREMTKNKGSVSGKTGRKARPVLDTAPKLADLGITKTQSSRWQKLAALSKDEQQEKVEEAKRKTEAVINPTPRKTTPRKPPKAELPSLPSAIDPLLSCESEGIGLRVAARNSPRPMEPVGQRVARRGRAHRASHREAKGREQWRHHAAWPPALNEHARQRRHS